MQTGLGSLLNSPPVEQALAEVRAMAEATTFLMSCALDAATACEQPLVAPANASAVAVVTASAVADADADASAQPWPVPAMQAAPTISYDGY